MNANNKADDARDFGLSTTAALPFTDLSTAVLQRRVVQTKPMPPYHLRGAYTTVHYKLEPLFDDMLQSVPESRVADMRSSSCTAYLSFQWYRRSSGPSSASAVHTPTLQETHTSIKRHKQHHRLCNYRLDAVRHHHFTPRFYMEVAVFLQTHQYDSNLTESPEPGIHTLLGYVFTQFLDAEVWLTPKPTALCPTIPRGRSEPQTLIFPLASQKDSFSELAFSPIGVM
ncbi:hypothetical protein QBC38DRAFT_455900 [Podospora fimiseda]|uniref:Uncharacterized protein n=1 Tax=Podospora fimiseda TaxID=252190 RepID=A0AAN7BNV2_9PEZI|nr:hypothetical protein QBC38DRAFT_455900 [Podospora fimiseda]